MLIGYKTSHKGLKIFYCCVKDLSPSGKALHSEFTKEMIQHAICLFVSGKKKKGSYLFEQIMSIFAYCKGIKFSYIYGTKQAHDIYDIC